MSNYKYFLIPFENVPANPPYQVWYATWSKTPPLLEPGMNPPMVVGATLEELPAGATLLDSGSKDPLPPPPPPPPGFHELDYQKAVTDWMMLGRSGDE